MLLIDEIRVENLIEGCVTDNRNPIISFSMSSDCREVALESATVKIDDWEKQVNHQLNIVYDGDLEPFTIYEIEIYAKSNTGETTYRRTSFQTGRLDTPWEAKWITDKSYLPEKGCSPIPMTFRKNLHLSQKIKKAYVTATAMGIYELEINGKQITKEYFAPGFTSYKHTLQYNYYDVTEYMEEENIIFAVVAGGWAVGRFTYESKSQITTERQAFLMELFVEYEDGTKDTILTDNTWQVTLDGNYRFGDFYDGEVYDATINVKDVCWKTAEETSLSFAPEITVQYGCPVTTHEYMRPVTIFTAPSGERIYDFGQNFAGVVCLEIEGKEGQEIIVRHAEVLNENELFVKTLRTAKAILTYICKEGCQNYSPKFTYMGFRYIGIRGIEEEKIKVSAYAIYSNIEEIGSFTCSNPLLNQLQRNILWSGKSNFVDIPTDCPQRDERQGWTGDISIFASTACYNFDLSRFLDKWLLDVKYEQGKGGGIPLVVPKHGNGAPTVSTACWGDCCILVPWALYLSNGDKRILQTQYPVMKRFLNSVKFWAGLGSIGKRVHIWKWLFQFGDWCAPDGYITDWMKKGKWIATAYYANSCNIMSQIAEILGEQEDSTYYKGVFQEICDAYIEVFTDKKGQLKREFQTGYVLPIAFDMVDKKTKRAMGNNLVRLIKENQWHLNTGFPATSFILFALCDTGRIEEAYRLLLQDTYPSWLYEVKCGATTFWERWDAMRPDGTINVGKLNKKDSDSDPGMCSYNHYAYGAVGDYFYRRILGVEAVTGGYENFQIKPVLGGGLKYAEGSHRTPFGTIWVSWKVEQENFSLEFEVPVSTRCTVVLPSGKKENFGSGRYVLSEHYVEPA
ncbi:MAG: family 78 glycoside hydrolase catalytic domain [Agathobacter sp.]|nr:family 78 glycoside hydrolase catalytic domain [Agathobacter sp.]